MLGCCPEEDREVMRDDNKKMMLPKRASIRLSDSTEADSMSATGSQERRLSITTTTTIEQTLPVESQPTLHCHKRLQSHHHHHHRHAKTTTRPIVCRQLATRTTATAAAAIHLITIATIALLQASALQSGPTTSNNNNNNILPTVIVRGFLNYRTTVDGTVLLFTPDAGASQPTAATAAVASTPPATSIKPTRVPQAEDWQVVQATAAPSAALSEGSQPMLSGAGDEWRPVVAATPPLRPLQTAFRPQNGFAANHDQLEPRATTTILAVAPETATPMQQDEPARDPPLTTTAENSPSSSSSSAPSPAPSVQADDVVGGGSSPLTHPPTTPASSPPPPTAARAHGRPKRPSLGFSGQAIRAGGKQRSAPPSSDSSSSSNNNINGLRRPALSTTAPPNVAPEAPAAQAATGAGSAVGSLFQGRLTSSSAKLRNRLRGDKARPAMAKPAGTGAAGANLTDLAAASATPSSSAAPPTVSADPNEPDQPNQPTSASPPAASLPPAEATSKGPQVGSDEVLTPPPPQSSTGSGRGGGEPAHQEEPQVAGDSGAAPTKRVGEQRPTAGELPLAMEPQLLSGSLLGSNAPELEQGHLGAMTGLGLDSFFQPTPAQPADQQQAPASSPQSPAQSAEASEQHAHHQQPSQQQQHKPKNNNDKLNGWLTEHHNKFVPRPATKPGDNNNESKLSSQLASTLNSLAPSFAAPHLSAASVKPTSTLDVNNSSSTLATVATEGGQQVEPMQTLTRTYSTTMTTSRTRLVPLQVKSSTAIHTITEHYVITKVLTAYQTMPAQGEFILPESSASTRSPFDVFSPAATQEGSQAEKEQPIAAPVNLGSPSPSAPQEQSNQEQPIQQQPKSPNDWLHDFSQPSSSLANDAAAQQQSALLASLQNSAQDQDQQQQQQLLLSNLLSGDQLDTSGLAASSLDPAALLAEGAPIPDLNNPLVLAAAIQNPQLAAVILAAQQLQLKQRSQLMNQQQQPKMQQQQLQPSYSTSLSTQIRPSTYTVRDTMYTTRLVSFKDGRTMRTRTVSEPGQVIEQVLTTSHTEITPVTLTIRPTGVASPMAQTQAPSSPQTPQATLNNALIAAQLAQLLNRRHQQAIQPSFQPGGSNQVAAQLQQLLAQQQQQHQQQQRPQLMAPKQFQPNLQQLLQSMQQPSGNNQNQPASAAKLDQAAATMPTHQHQAKQAAKEPTEAPPASSSPTPPLGPIVTTLTNLQVRTYTVHNAFKTIYRTITSTQLLTSTILRAG